MSVQEENLLLGCGELFIKRENDTSGKYIHVGTLASKAKGSFAYAITTVEQTPGNRLAPVRRDKTGEKATLKLSVCDFKIDQLIYALGQSISLTQLTGTTTLRIYQEVTFTSTTNTVTLAKAPVSLTSVVITSLDRGTRYVRGSHYSLPGSIGVKPITTTFAHKTHFVSYDADDTGTKRVMVGDKTTLQIVDLKFTTKDANGKYMTIEIPRATIVGGLTIPFSEKDYTEYDLTFEALGDPTKAAGRSLFKITRQV